MDKKELRTWKKSSLIDFYANLIINSKEIFDKAKELMPNFTFPTKCEIVEYPKQKTIVREINFSVTFKNGDTEIIRLTPAVKLINRGTPVADYINSNNYIGYQTKRAAIRKIINKKPEKLDKKELAEWKRCCVLDFMAVLVSNASKTLKQKNINFSIPTSENNVLQDSNTKSIIFTTKFSNGDNDESRIIPAVVHVIRDGIKTTKEYSK